MQTRASGGNDDEDTTYLADMKAMSKELGFTFQQRSADSLEKCIAELTLRDPLCCIVLCWSQEKDANDWHTAFIIHGSEAKQRFTVADTVMMQTPVPFSKLENGVEMFMRDYVSAKDAYILLFLSKKETGPGKKRGKKRTQEEEEEEEEETLLQKPDPLVQKPAQPAFGQEEEEEALPQKPAQPAFGEEEEEENSMTSAVEESHDKGLKPPKRIRRGRVSKK